MNINLTFDSSAASMPAAMVTAIEYAANFYDAWFTNPITVNIAVGYGEIDGVTLAANQGAEGRFNYVQVSYGALEPILSAQDGGAVLPSTDPTGGAGVYVSDAEAKALGLISSTSTAVDGYIGFLSEPYYATDPNNRAQPGMEDFIGIAEHEISEALGRRGDGLSPVGALTVADLFAYSAPVINNAESGALSYFSTDGGFTNLGNYYSVGQDYIDWDYATTGLDAFRGGITLDTVSPITPRDEAQMAALGFTEGPGAGLGLPLVTLTDTNSFGSTLLTEAANEYFLYNAVGYGPYLQDGGAVVLAGSLGGWVPFGAVQTASGYDVAWELPGANEFTVWSTDSNGNYITNLIGETAGSDYALESFETTFNQDLSGDGTIGPTKTAIQTDTNSSGSTSLMAVANEYFVSTASSDPVLQDGGAVVAGSLGGWVPFGAVQTASGYDVAWELPGANEFTVWSTDSNGNYIGNLIGETAGNDYALESFETTFNQDLNGDGTIGPTKTVIQTDTNSLGSTSLMAVANEYFLYNASGSGPVLQDGGAVVAGSSGGWVPFGAVQTASGYDVAWELLGANEFTVWSTDSNGTYIANLIGETAGNDYALESFETTFNQDLNGDGTTGPTKTVIQTDTNSSGSTSLMAVANEYFLYNASGSGSVLQDGGAVVAGSSGGWVPFGAVQTASGYDVAWELPGANEFTVWSTDSNGNYITNLIGETAGNDYALESFETTFNQDLNGDGTIGPTKTVIQTDTNSLGSTSLMAVANEYFLYNASGSGPVLQDGGAVVAGSSGGWVPFGAVQTASGYDVAWELPGANELTVWSTDSNGNYIANLIGETAGNDYALESFETTFNQDLNGDGTIGPTKTVIQTDTNSLGSTSLMAVANEYFLYNVSGSGPVLQDGGAVVAGSSGGWVPFGALQTASGYDVAWELPGANEFTVWRTDSNGTYIANLIGETAGNDYALESFETTFNQDLNGDGVIGLYAAPGTTLQISASLAGTSGAAIIGTGATLELGAADSATVTFHNSTATTGTLRLDDAPTFSGEIFNFTGNGTLSGSDQIDLTNISYSSVQDSYANGVLTVTDGTNTAKLNFNGSYSSANFSLASDGSGGTIVYDPPTPPAPGVKPTSTSPGASATIGTGATLDLAAAYSGSVILAGSAGTPKLDQPSTFAGTVFGFGAQDAIELSAIAFNAQTTLGYLPNSNQTGGALTVTNGTHSASIALLGNYIASSFAAVGDGGGGTMVVAEASPGGSQAVLTNPQHA